MIADLRNGKQLYLKAANELEHKKLLQFIQRVSLGMVELGTIDTDDGSVIGLFLGAINESTIKVGS